ncbi:MAG: RNB domain-containing ribonuclease [Deltaproteobacteria bacterium]|nr:MAG: RNB domain-containing ribonuclease [Deltaproteobacteria bacterium]
MEREIIPGTKVEFFESKRLLCAVCMEIKSNRVLVITEQDRQANIAVKRILNLDDTLLDVGQSRSQLVAALKETADRRRGLMTRVSVEDLWDLLNEEEEGFDCQQLAEICFSDEVGGDHASAVLRALLSDGLHFKYKGGLFYPNSPEKLERIRLQHEREAQREQELVEGSLWLAAVWRDEPVPDPSRRDHYLKMLKDFCLLGTEAPNYQQIKKILSLAQIPVPQGVFQLLVRLGIWKEHENLYLHRYGIQADFPSQVLDAASQIQLDAEGVGAEKQNHERNDLTSLPLLTIDGPMTRDYDDALSVRPLANGFEVGVHIADAAEAVSLNSPLDKEALERATSLYLPDAKIPMLPTQLSEGICSLKQGEERLALSLLIRFAQTDELEDYRFVLSRVKVQRQLTYTEANGLLANDDTLGYLYRLGTRLRRQRIANGALFLPLPELRVWINHDNEIHISTLDRETPAQVLISELMILANSLAGDALASNALPAIYRSQEKPQEVVTGAGGDDLYLNYLQRRYLSRAELTVAPKPHSGLGTGAYTNWTSPIRRYSDLIVQRQLKCMVLAKQPDYTPADLEGVIGRIAQTQNQAMQIKREWTRYWVLKHFEKKRIKSLDALVLGQGRRTYQLLLPEYLLEASMPLEEGRGLNPGDHFRVEIVRVNAREEVLKLTMA